MAKGVIDGSGIREMKSANIKQGHTYYMGASSSPDLIYIEDITPNKITYRKYPYYPEDKLTRRRDVIEDLIVQGNETVRESRRPNKFIDRDTNLKEIQRRRIKFKVTNNMSAREVERKYRDQYGLETNLGEGNNTYITTVNRDKISGIKNLPGIKVLESKKPSEPM